MDIGPRGKSSSSHGDEPALDCSELVAGKGAKKDEDRIDDNTHIHKSELTLHDADE